MVRGWVQARMKRLHHSDDFPRRNKDMCCDPITSRSSREPPLGVERVRACRDLRRACRPDVEPGQRTAGHVALSSGSGTPGSTVTLSLTMSATGGAQPSGLQWTMGYSSSDITSVVETIGSAASAAGKSLQCATGAGHTAWSLGSTPRQLETATWPRLPSRSPGHLQHQRAGYPQRHLWQQRAGRLDSLFRQRRDDHRHPTSAPRDVEQSVLHPGKR